MKLYARDINDGNTDNEPSTTTVTALFKHGDEDEGAGYVQYTIVVYQEDAGYFESKLLDEVESIFYAQKQAVEPIRRLVP